MGESNARMFSPDGASVAKIGIISVDIRGRKIENQWDGLRSQSSQ
jgi:hypothetical protein